jgi:SNF2 domain-containing protein/helicase-like protein
MPPRIVRFQHVGDGDTLISAEHLSEGVWAEICSVLLSYGASPGPDGFGVTALSLRLAANELGELLLRHDIRATYDDSTLRLLRAHLAEFHARVQAEQDRSSLPESEVLRLIGQTSRFTRPLTDTQKRDLGRLLRLNHGANFSVPGAGKTTALLAIYEALRGAGTVDRLLVIAPKNAFLSWEDEVALCYRAPSPVIARISGGAAQATSVLARDPEIALITYQFLPNVLPMLRTWASAHRTHVVLDESHRIKSGFAGVYAFAALQLADVAVRRDALTGTPLPNSPEDLRAQLEFLWPGQRILPETRLHADDPDQVLLEVQRSVVPLYVRTTKEELRLPKLEVVPIAVTLGPLQRELYEHLRSEASRMAAGFSTQDIRLLRRLGAHVIKLLQGASDPMLLAANEDIDLDAEDSSWSKVWDLLREIARSEVPSKISKAIHLAESDLESSPENKVLIWTSFVQNVLSLEKSLSRWGPVVIYGAVATGSDEDADTREGRIRKFHSDPACRVMIANPAACGEGISLHKACHHAIYLDRTFNAAHYLQSVDRIHRLGLAQDVITRIHILEASDTIDSRVATRLKAKIDSMSLILNDPGLAALAYDPLDVVEQFPAGIEPEDVEQIIEHLIHKDTEQQ